MSTCNEPGSSYPFEPGSVADVDPLASVLRVHSDAQIVVSAATARECDNLKRLLPYRGVDESRVSISPGGPAQVTVTKGH